MATLQNSVQKCEDLTSFQEMFNTCYSHGLESIYKLENVDLKSVRKLAIIETPTQLPIREEEEWFEEQLSLDFGPFYREWMVPYVTLEPIQVLQLAKPIEKTLIGFGFKTIGDLQKLNLQSLKIGQGHIEDVRQKLHAYLFHKPLQKTRHIDFLSLIKCLCADKDPCKVYAMLEAYGLHEWMALTPSEAMEVKRSLVKREWIEEIRSQILQEVRAFFPIIIETWVRPWMQRRGGCATQEEIEEFLMLQSLDPLYAEKALKLFGPVYDSLVVTDSYFAISKTVALEYQLVDKTLKSYFVNPSACFLLSELVTLVLKELAKAWHAITKETVLQMLHLSPAYRLFRSSDGTWLVTHLTQEG